MLAAFVVTVLAGLAINFGLHYLVAGILLNVWFLVALALADDLPARISADESDRVAAAPVDLSSHEHLTGPPNLLEHS